MKKSTVVTIIIIVILVAGAGAIWYSMQQGQREAEPESSQPSTQESPQSEQSAPSEQEAAENQVAIKDFAFSPAKITVKKGTTVTWTNEDSVGHNVVADDATNSGGLPTSHALLAQGQTFSHTFNEVGTFNYHCAPHPHMKGVVEVVE